MSEGGGEFRKPENHIPPRQKILLTTDPPQNKICAPRAKNYLAGQVFYGIPLTPPPETQEFPPP